MGVDANVEVDVDVCAGGGCSDDGDEDAECEFAVCGEVMGDAGGVEDEEEVGAGVDGDEGGACSFVSASHVHECVGECVERSSCWMEEDEAAEAVIRKGDTVLDCESNDVRRETAFGTGPPGCYKRIYSVHK